MKILVTGVTGFIGGHLAPALVDAGHEVYGVVRDLRRARGSWTPVEWDLMRPLERDRLPRVEAVVHLAQANVPFPEHARELYRVNTVSTQELLDYARETGARRVLYASSATVYGLGRKPFRETDAVAYEDFYAVTKINAEQLVGTYRSFFDTVVFRFVAPYGPGQQGRLIPRLIDRVDEGLPIRLAPGGRPRMNPIYVDDVIRVLLAALELDGHQLLNVGGDEVAGIDELAQLVGDVLGREPIFEHAAEGARGDVVVDTSRLHKLLPLRPLVPLADGLRRTTESRLAAGAAR